MYINPYKLFVGSFIPNWIMSRTEISNGAKLCYARLCQFAGKDGNCFPIMETLAKEIGCSERSLYDYIQELKNAKLISVLQQGQGKPNRYLFLSHEWMCIADRQNPATLDRQNPAALGSQKSATPYKEENQLRESTKMCKAPSPIQKVLAFYKTLKGYDVNDKDWDRANFARYTKIAKNLLSVCGSVENAIQYMDEEANKLDKLGVSWHIGTLERRAWDVLNKDKKRF